MSTLPHKIRFIKTSTRKKSNQLKSLPSCLFLANSDPAPAYAQLVVLYNKIRAGHTTFLLLITNMCHTNNFSRLAHGHTGCLWQSQNTDSHRRGETSLFPRGPPAVPWLQERNLSILTPLNTPDSRFTLQFALPSFSERNLLNKWGYYMLNKLGYYIPHTLPLNTGLLLFGRTVLFAT